jgi:molecular chaperone GrpE
MADHHKKTQTHSRPEIEELERQVLELTEALQRERADAINVRRRAEEDRFKMASFFKATVIKDLLPFIDNFERALNHTPKTADKAMRDWLAGLNRVNKLLYQELESLDVKKIKTINEVFDPRYHEAVQMDPNSEGTKEVITEEFMPGYTLDGEVIRHAMVKVSMK